jgi:hypothetical protein
MGGGEGYDLIISIVEINKIPSETNNVAKNV